MNIDIKDFIDMNVGLRNVIDIRSNDIYNKGSIPNAINIPRRILLVNPDLYLDKNKTYYLYCEEGKFSKKVSKELNELGFTTYSINGGYEAFKKLREKN